MCGWTERALVALLALGIACAAPAAGGRYGLGTPATPEQIAGWDIDARPDGAGLPPGQGTAAQGEAQYVELCASCHGEFGEGRGRFPALMGGRGTLKSAQPVKTIGSFWPHATTVFDFLRRAKPFGHAQSLEPDQVYALTAYLLYLNELVGLEEVMDAGTLPAVRMPNRDGFVADDRPDTPVGEPCMRDCRGAVTVTSSARGVGVTPARGALPEQEPAPPGAGDPGRGRALWRRCAACHSLQAGEHRAGPSLHAIFGRRAGAEEGYGRYSEALKGAELVWDEDSLSRFLLAPREFVAGTTMPPAGLRGPAEARDLLSYLRQAARRP